MCGLGSSSAAASWAELNVHLHVCLGFFGILDIRAFTVKKDFDDLDRPGHVINVLPQETGQVSDRLLSFRELRPFTYQSET